MLIDVTMAEVCRIENQVSADKKSAVSQEEHFCVFSVLCVFISLITILADFTTDLLVLAEYCKDGNVYWAIATLVFILSPNIIINIFSLRWFAIDQKSSLRHWVTHGFLLGFLERYVSFIRKAFTCQNLESTQMQNLVSRRNELSMLHFIYIFTGTVPQIVLHTYSIIILEENYYTKVFALAASYASVIWGCSTYFYGIMAFSDNSFLLIPYVLKLMWHFGLLVARIFGIILFIMVFGVWTLLPLGIHWTAMTIWIIIQNTTFCSNKIEETLYNIVMGFVYCFCYINLKEGRTRYRLLLFYTLMVTQNFGSLFLYVLVIDHERQQNLWSVCASTCIIVGTMLGICAMIFYYRYFHSNGPLQWNSIADDFELNNKMKPEDSLTSKNNALKHMRSFKSIKNNSRPAKMCPRDAQVELKAQNENTDKKVLLDHWMTRSGLPVLSSIPTDNISMDTSSIDVYTVENTPQSLMLQKKANMNLKVCLPTELSQKFTSIENLESSIDTLTSSNLALQKRRGICSSDELREDLSEGNIETYNIVNKAFNKNTKMDYSHAQEIEGYSKKTSSDSIDMDLDLSLSDINSSDINTFNENIVQKLCLSALKNIKVGNQDADIENIQRIAIDILKEMYTKKDRSKTNFHIHSLTSKRDLDTPTENLSVHDYENICAVNIAREAWGLRSWNGYSDIENWLHDGSVVRDRRRDTLTSASTEISSCVSQELMHAILSAPPFPKRAPTYSNVFVKFEKSNHDEYIIETGGCQSNDVMFVAKPCIVDSGKDTQLEPIVEELDDLGDIGSSKKRLNSESSLVATIDEIRKVTVTNSPRNLYHRTEHWDSPQLNASNKVECNLKKALWKEPSKFDSKNIMASLPEKENILNVPNLKCDLKITDGLFSHSEALDIDNVENVLSCSRNKGKREIGTTLKCPIKKYANQPEQNLQDLSNKEIDFLWQLVSENSIPPSSTVEFSASRITTSLQSLIQKDCEVQAANKPVKISNIRKGIKSRPRRKFSMLRDKFEPKGNFNSDEEILCHYSEKSSSADSNAFKVNNDFDLGNQNHDTIKASVNLGKDKKCSIFVPESTYSKTIKEKRSMFMRQVLSPPKFNTKLRYKV